MVMTREREKVTQSTDYRRYKLLAHLPHHSQTANIASEGQVSNSKIESQTVLVDIFISTSFGMTARLSQKQLLLACHIIPPHPLLRKALQKGYSTLDCYSTGVFCINFSRSTNSKGGKLLRRLHGRNMIAGNLCFI